METRRASIPDFKFTIDKELHSSLLNEISQLGKDKPLGSMPLETLAAITGKSPEEDAQDLEASGLKTLILSKSHIVSSALYSYDEKHLSDLLTRNSEILQENGWPIESAEFVEFAHNNIAKGEVLKILSEAYGDSERV